MTKNNRNVRVIAVNNYGHAGFNIYLDFSGQWEYLAYHRHNGLLYRLLKDGVAIDDMKRWKPSKLKNFRTGRTVVSKMHNMVGHLNAVIDDYMTEREAD